MKPRDDLFETIEHDHRFCSTCFTKLKGIARPSDLFLSGLEPDHDPAPERWATIVEVDPDVVIDLHSSRGIYGELGNAVGQAIFPAPDGSVIASRV